MAKSTRRVQTAKPRGKKSFTKSDTAVQRGERYGRSDRRSARIDTRNYR